MKERKFDFGELVTTSSVQEQTIIDPDFDAFADDCFIRHICGDWEDLEPEDAELNEQALIFMSRREKGSGSLQRRTEA